MEEHINKYQYLKKIPDSVVFRENKKNLKVESYGFAAYLYYENKNNRVIINSGVDSQIILHSFLSQNLPISTVFFLVKGINDEDLYFTKYLERLYNIKIDIHVVSKNNVEEEIIKILSNYIDKGERILNGIHFPSLTKHHDEFFLINRRIIFEEKFTSNNYVEWSKCSQIFESIMHDQVLKEFLTAFDYFKNANFLNRKLSNIDYWNNYIKIHVYTKYWGDDLFYFPGNRIFKIIETPEFTRIHL